jgi:hypothetical protein
MNSTNENRQYSSPENDTFDRKKQLHKDNVMINKSAIIDANTIDNVTIDPLTTSPNSLFIKDIQRRLIESQKEIIELKFEINSNEQKLSSSLQSIKQFWSPELKKERNLRKEDSKKIFQLMDQINCMKAQLKNQAEINERNLSKLLCLQEQITEKDNNQLDGLKNINAIESDNKILRKTVKEFKLIIDSQQQTIDSKNECSLKLIELLKMMSKKISHETEYEFFNESFLSDIVRKYRENKVFFLPIINLFISAKRRF